MLSLIRSASNQTKRIPVSPSDSSHPDKSKITLSTVPDSGHCLATGAGYSD